MDRLNERRAALAALLSLAGLALDAALRARTGLEVFAALLPFLALGALLGGLVHLREWLARRAAEERQDAELARRERPEARLFEAPGGETEPFTLARTRVQVEGAAARLAAPLLAVLQGLAAWRLHAGLAGTPPAVSGSRLLAAALLAGQAFVLFIPSRYLLGLSREEGRRLLRGPGIALGLAALGSLAGALAAVASASGVPAADRWVATALAALLALLAAESLAAAVVSAYRPRDARAAPSTAYESRLGRLLTDPSGWVRGAAQALDYQFGFRVSQTWFFRFLARAVVPLALFQLVGLYALSCVVALGPEEVGLRERFGRPLPDAAGGRLGSGLHVKRPWPFETVRRLPAHRVLVTHVGYEAEAAAPAGPILWTRPHFQREDQFLVASRGDAGSTAPDGTVPVNLVSFNVPVEYRIRDPRAWAYGFADPAAALRQVAYRSLTRETAGRDLFGVLGAGQREAAEALRTRIQAEADRLGLGVEVLFVGLQGVHPPVPVAESFEAVVGAIEEKEAAVHAARGYRAGRLAAAGAEARRAVLAATADRVRREEVSAAERDQFLRRKEGADAAPGVFRSRHRLDAVRTALARTRTYVVVGAPAREVLQLNFEERAPASLFDLSPTAAPEKTP